MNYLCVWSNQVLIFKAHAHTHTNWLGELTRSTTNVLSIIRFSASEWASVPSHTVCACVFAGIHGSTRPRKVTNYSPAHHGHRINIEKKWTTTDRDYRVNCPAIKQFLIFGVNKSHVRRSREWRISDLTILTYRITSIKKQLTSRATMNDRADNDNWSAPKINSLKYCLPVRPTEVWTWWQFETNVLLLVCACVLLLLFVVDPLWWRNVNVAGRGRGAVCKQANKQTNKLNLRIKCIKSRHTSSVDETMLTTVLWTFSVCMQYCLPFQLKYDKSADKQSTLENKANNSWRREERKQHRNMAEGWFVVGCHSRT